MLTSLAQAPWNFLQGAFSNSSGLDQATNSGELGANLLDLIIGRTIIPVANYAFFPSCPARVGG
jgi:hypothetical protein